ncbi:hypothetical protein [Paractinoplanes lichenicola]|uniref:Uncharacterized protein n=1 Tax=Paractinoplanes lichenicola TaxID=2802976 RepID=A0ABS1VF33_9ACTN|nr:hypothetical protein [Actinoplanes lichenicola]MBL7253313.1 hypothetical protein [Actinoplanes lichenicola]
MTDPARRPLNPGGGPILRRTYGRLLAISVVTVLLVWAIAISVLAISDGHAVLIALAYAVLAVASLCLLAATARARAAIHDDVADLPGLRLSATLTRIASYAGWAGALPVVVTGIVQDAVLAGIVLAATALILGTAADGTHRITTRILTT